MTDPNVSAGLLEVLRERQVHGVIGRAPLSAHVRHAEAFHAVTADLLPSEPRILDLGSGAGLPGLVLAELIPSAVVVLVESRQLRCIELVEAVERLGLRDRVEVVDRRAEDAARDVRLRGTFDLVTARSFARPAVTAECGAPFLLVGGLLVVSEPPEPSESTRRWPADGLAKLGLRVARRETSPRAMIVLELEAPSATAYPRRPGIPEKRPLF